MNINDVQEEVTVPDNILKAIFDKQRELALKYHPIEERSGLLQTTDFPVDLNDPKGQARLKDLAWRTVEELGEAGECEEVDKEHFREEIIDSVHFFVELLLSAGMDHNDFKPIDKVPVLTFCSFSQALSDFVIHLGISMNFLKNKPWKQTHMETDTRAFKDQLVETFEKLVQVLSSADLDDVATYMYYFKKNAVNKFRQRSNY